MQTNPEFIQSILVGIIVLVLAVFGIAWLEAQWRKFRNEDE